MQPISFWTDSFGEFVTGDPNKLSNPVEAVIPKDTEALAAISRAELTDDNFNKVSMYQITWKIVDGDYMGRFIKQKIKVFDPSLTVRDKAKQMLAIIFNMFNVPLPPSAPGEMDLMLLLGKIATIKLGTWKIHDKQTGDTKEGNLVTLVSPVPSTQAIPEHAIDQASRFVPDSDIPF